MLDLHKSPLLPAAKGLSLWRFFMNYSDLAFMPHRLTTG
jgi:hypothetical protein